MVTPTLGKTKLGSRSPYLAYLYFLLGFSLSQLLVISVQNGSKSLTDKSTLLTLKDESTQNCGAAKVTSSSTISLANQKRPTRKNCNGNVLVCAWPLDSVNSQLVSRHLAARTKNESYIPEKNLSMEEGHLDDLNTKYETGDKALLSTGIVKLDMESSIHVIPMGEEPYFRRSLRDCNLVMDGMLRWGKEPQPGEEWLDFGGSHGRLAQIMAAAYPETQFHVCDPIKDTVEWAASKIQNVEFFLMNQRPPTNYQNDQFSGIYALSIWSHYSEEAALLWFEEMHRILRKGCQLWFSTHGFVALNFGAESSNQAINIHKQTENMLQDLYLRGHFYYPMFGKQGDWGVDDGADGSWWGYGGFTTEWLAAKVLNVQHSPWKLEYFGPGVNEYHQDVYVLKKI